MSLSINPDADKGKIQKNFIGIFFFFFFFFEYVEQLDQSGFARPLTAETI